MGAERHDGGVMPSSMSMVPLTNKQVDIMRREEYMTTSFSQERPAAARASTSSTTPQMGYGQHGKNVWEEEDNIIVVCSASPGTVARLQLDTDPYDSPLPSQRSTLRRDSHILAEISELESSFANQEQVNTRDSQDSQNWADVIETLETALAEADTIDTAPVVNDTSDTSEPTERGAARNIELLKLFDDAEQSFNMRFD